MCINAHADTTQNLKVKILKVEWGKRETERVFTYAAHAVLLPCPCSPRPQGDYEVFV